MVITVFLKNWGKTLAFPKKVVLLQNGNGYYRNDKYYLK